jgi:hypothetical protein
MLFQKGVDAQALETALRPLQPGAFISYSALSALISRDVQTEARPVLETARKTLLAEGIRFDVVRAEGLKRMTDAEIALSGTSEVRGVHRRANAGLRRLSAVRDFDGLQNGEKVAHNTAAAQLGILSHASSSHQTKRLTKTVGTVRLDGPTTEAIAAIVDGLKK